MFQTLLPFAALFLTGLVAGTVNTLAGGGSLLSLPVMIFLGLPATVANGTLRMAILIQNVGSVWGFGRQGVFEPTLVKRFLPPALLGVVAGTALGVRMGDLAFQRTLAVVMVLVALWVVWKPPGGTTPSTDPSSGRKGPAGILLYGGFFLVGAYGGFIQAGVGFLILALTSAAGLDLVKGNAMKVLLVLCFTPLALLGYAMAGRVDWAMGLALGTGSFLGGLMGARLAVLRGHAWIRRVVTLLVVIFAVRLWLGS
jgi:uncharacterized membrane protein YfcA